MINSRKSKTCDATKLNHNELIRHMFALWIRRITRESNNSVCVSKIASGALLSVRQACDHTYTVIFKIKKDTVHHNHKIVMTAKRCPTSKLQCVITTFKVDKLDATLNNLIFSVITLPNKEITRFIHAALFSPSDIHLNKRSKQRITKNIATHRHKYLLKKAEVTLLGRLYTTRKRIKNKGQYRGRRRRS